jgi:hypothetical protein
MNYENEQFEIIRKMDKFEYPQPAGSSFEKHEELNYLDSDSSEFLKRFKKIVKPVIGGVTIGALLLSEPYCKELLIGNVEHENTHIPEKEITQPLFPNIALPGMTPSSDFTGTGTIYPTMINNNKQIEKNDFSELKNYLGTNQHSSLRIDDKIKFDLIDQKTIKFYWKRRI